MEDSLNRQCTDFVQQDASVSKAVDKKRPHGAKTLQTFVNILKPTYLY